MSTHSISSFCHHEHVFAKIVFNAHLSAAQTTGYYLCVWTRTHEHGHASSYMQYSQLVCTRQALARTWQVHQLELLVRCTVQYRSDATITLAHTKLSSHECKYTRVQIISGQSILNIYGGSHDQVLDIDFSH